MTIVLTNKQLRWLSRGADLLTCDSIRLNNELIEPTEVIAQLAAEVLRLRAERRRRIEQEEGDRG